MIMEETIGTKIPHLNVEKAWEKAKLLKEDLEIGRGWTRRYRVPNEFNSWSKTFPSDDVPVRIVYSFENMPMSAEEFAEMMSPKNLELRSQWDTTTTLEVLEKLPSGGCILRSALRLSFPFSDRDYILYCSPPYETNDWFGKKAFGIFFLDSTHAARPAGADGIIRATNGGNFYIAVQDEEQPEHKCEAFMLTTNNYNGWIPHKNESMVAKKAPRVFHQIRQCMIEGYNEYFKRE